MQDKHSIDNFFKQGLGDPDIPFDERDWEALTQKIEAQKKSKLPLVIWLSGGIAASLAIVSLLLFQLQTSRQQEATLLSGTELPHDVVIGQRQHTEAMEDNKEENIGTTDLSHQYKSNENSQTVTTIIIPDEDMPISKSYPAILSRVESLKPVVHPLHIANTGNMRSYRFSQVASNDAHTSGKTVSAVNDNLNTRWMLSIVAAPDLSGTQVMDGRLSGNIGVTATYHFTKRISITSGVLYANKRYQTAFSNYQPRDEWPRYRIRPNLVDADCRVLDIPLSVNYTLLQGARSSWIVTGGLSSYLMLSESYSFSYLQSESTYSQGYTLHNENRHLFGVANIGIGYQRKLNPYLNITVQPFVKAPLSGIGQGNVRLYSTGVTLSVDFDPSRRR